MKSMEELKAIRDRVQKEKDLHGKPEGTYRVVVGLATCGIAAGARPVMDTLQAEVERLGLKNVTVSQVGCIGVCRLEPIVEVYAPDKEKVTYVKMDAEKAKRVAEEHLAKNQVVLEYTIGAAQ